MALKTANLTKYYKNGDLIGTNSVITANGVVVAIIGIDTVGATEITQSEYAAMRAAHESIGRVKQSDGGKNE